MSLAQPAWLILLALLPILGVAAIGVAHLRRRQWSEFVAPRLRGTLLRRGSPLPRWFALAFLLAACAALIGALSRPKADAGTRTEKTLGRNVLFALDLSRSMRVQDVKPDRLTQAKTVIFELIESMPNERVGLIGFAGSAYLYAPLTVDHRAVRETVDQIDETWAPLGGSNLSEALKLAIETLKKTGQKNNALVILSDGEKHDGDISQMISEAERSGVYILAIGVGTEDGDYVPNPDFPGNRMLDRDAQPILSRLQADVMRELATETKGRYVVAGSGADIAGIVKAAVKDLDAFEMEGRERRITVEFYQWLLLPGILFLMVSVIAGTRWRGVGGAAAAMAAAFALVPPSGRADEVSDAAKALEGRRFPEARNAYRKLAEESRLPDRRAAFRLGEAAAAYQDGEFKQARSAFSRAMLSRDPAVAARGHAGMGNTLFQLGWRSLTGESYPTENAGSPDMGFFDGKVKDVLAAVLQDDDGDGYARIRDIITNWSDAARHFESAAPDPASANNRQLVTDYLKRLQELLEEEQQKTEQSMPQPQPGEGEPKQGDPGEGEPKEGESGENGEQPPKDQGAGDEEEKKDPAKGNEGDNPPEKEKDGKDQERQGDKGKNPDETPEEKARRILKENADLEKGPLTPGRREFRPPEKDW